MFLGGILRAAPRQHAYYPQPMESMLDDNETVFARLRIGGDVRGAANFKSRACRAFSVQQPLKFVSDRSVEIFCTDINDAKAIRAQGNKLNFLQTKNIKPAQDMSVDLAFPAVAQHDWQCFQHPSANVFDRF